MGEREDVRANPVGFLKGLLLGDAKLVTLTRDAVEGLRDAWTEPADLPCATEQQARELGARGIVIDGSASGVWVFPGAEQADDGASVASHFRLASPYRMYGSGGGMFSIALTRRQKRITRALLETALEELDAYEPVDPIVPGGIGSAP